MPPPARPKKTLALTGIAALVGEFEDPKRSEENDETTAAAAATSARVPVGLETRDARSRRIAREKKARHADKLQRQLETYDPKRDTNAGDTDPYKTLFVGRLSYDADEETLRREFETFGDVRTVTIPKRRIRRRDRRRPRTTPLRVRVRGV
jgi:U1 small nuclear ribonucleoprotein